jgi:hypothetical protein
MKSGRSNKYALNIDRATICLTIDFEFRVLRNRLCGVQLFFFAKLALKFYQLPFYPQYKIDQPGKNDDKAEYDSVDLSIRSQDICHFNIGITLRKRRCRAET